jgi:hypothetical protein
MLGDTPSRWNALAAVVVLESDQFPLANGQCFRNQTDFFNNFREPSALLIQISYIIQLLA